MRGLGFGLTALAAAFGFVAGCGDTDEGAPSGNDAGSAGQSDGGAGSPSAGKAGAVSGGSSDGTTIAGASASGSASGGTSVGSKTGGGSSAGMTAEGGAPAGGNSGLFDCDAKKVTCKIATPQCSALEVPSIDGSCWGKCVKISQCACGAADDCPDQNQYTCWSKQHCGPYVL